MGARFFGVGVCETLEATDIWALIINIFPCGIVAADGL